MPKILSAKTCEALPPEKEDLKINSQSHRN